MRSAPLHGRPGPDPSRTWRTQSSEKATWLQVSTLANPKTTSRKPFDDALSLRRDISDFWRFSFSVSRHHLSSTAAHADWPFFLQRKERLQGRRRRRQQKMRFAVFRPLNNLREEETETKRAREREISSPSTL